MEQSLGNGTEIFFVLAMVLLTFICSIDYVSADDNSATDYEQFYPKYMDSKEPLGVIRDRDHQIEKTATRNLRLQSIPFPITMPYGSLPLQKLDIYRLPGKKLKPVSPAKAGVQNILGYWIPAFAGMTIGQFFGFFS